jgi:hypothetical protein
MQMNRARQLLHLLAFFPTVACGALADVGSFTDASDAMNAAMSDRAESSLLAGDGISDQVVTPPNGDMDAASIGLDALFIDNAESASTDSWLSPETGSLDANSCEGAPPVLGDASALCGAPPTPIVPFGSAADLADLVVGQWYRCEGPLQPQGGAVAPDGQSGLEFELNAGTNQGALDGLIPSGTPCYGFGLVLPYVGGERYGQVNWAFASVPSDAGDGGPPGIVFQDTAGLVVYDQPIFSDQGNRMSLSDSIWNGTYVRIR